MEDDPQEQRDPAVILAKVVADLRLVRELLSSTVAEVREEGTAEMGTADDIEALSERADVVAELGRMLAERTVEVAAEIREYEEVPEVFDEEVAYAAFVGFLSERIGIMFTAADLKAYFDGQGVVYPEKVAEFNKLFKAWRDEASAELRTGERTLVWAPITKQKGEPQQYALAPLRRRTVKRPELVVPTPPEPDEPEPDTSSASEPTVEAEDEKEGIVATPKPAEQPAPGVAVEEEEGLSNEAVLAFNIYLAGRNDRATVLYARLTQTVRGLEEDQAAAAFAELVAAGKLYKRREGGSLYFSIEPPAPKPERGQPKAENDDSRAELDDEQKQLAKIVLDYLAHTRHPGQLVEPRTMVADLRAEPKYADWGITNKKVNAICRAMERQGLVLTAQAKEGRKRALAKRATVFKVGMDKDMAQAYKHDPKPFTDAIDRAEPFSLEVSE